MRVDGHAHPQQAHNVESVALPSTYIHLICTPLSLFVQQRPPHTYNTHTHIHIQYTYTYNTHTHTIHIRYTYTYNTHSQGNIFRSPAPGGTPGPRTPLALAIGLPLGLIIALLLLLLLFLYRYV